MLRERDNDFVIRFSNADCDSERWQERFSSNFIEKTNFYLQSFEKNESKKTCIEMLYSIVCMI